MMKLCPVCQVPLILNVQHTCKFKGGSCTFLCADDMNHIKIEETPRKIAKPRRKTKGFSVAAFGRDGAS